jgi:pyruvate/2-oxoacid:ferredoxin oxidoreductase beta subunit
MRSGEQRLLSKRKEMVRIFADHGIPYAATASIAYPLDFMRKVEKAIAIDGPTYIHLQVPCLVGWSIDENMGVAVSRAGVQTRMHPLYEVENGKRYTITVDVKEAKPVEEYLKLQGRFKHLFKEDNTDAVAQMQHDVDENWAYLKYLAARP